MLLLKDGWLPFLSQLVDREDRRKSALETRATGLATISASVIAILTAGSAIGARVGIGVPDSALVAAAIALLLFLSSIVSSIVANLPVRLSQADPAGLLSHVRESVNNSNESVWATIAATYVAEYNSLCKANKVKAVALWTGLSCQILGCIALSVFVLFVL